mmetsp:Transcript_17872/g.44554  ORF Transcript_17872/g.44554 Transcript_17872/m.44554 type:complete len:844 (+) Transcript_17872:162-2693(+)
MSTQATPNALQPAQETVLGILTLISGFTSFCSSTWIIVEVMTTRAKLVSVYNRLLLAMSIADILSSIGHMLGPLPIPEEYDYEVTYAEGNVTTCNAQGFLVQLGIVAPVYHVFLSIYYLLLVKFEVTQDKIVKYAEPLMHSTAILVGFGTGTASIALDLYTGNLLWCWIAPFPKYYRVWFFYAPLWVSMLLVLGINVWIYRSVYRREQQAGKLHAMHHEKHGRRYFGEDRKERTTSIIVPEGKRPSLRMFSFPSSKASISSRPSLVSKRMSSRRSPVSFTFGQRPSRIFSLTENGSNQDNEMRKGAPSFNGLDSIREGLSAEESIGSGKSNSADENRSHSVSELPPQQDDEQQPTPDATNESAGIASPLKEMFTNQTEDDETPQIAMGNRGELNTSRSLPELMPSMRGETTKPAGLAVRFKEMFTPQTVDQPSFIFKRETNDQLFPDDEDENYFRNSINSIQRIILPQRSAKRFSQKILRRRESVNSIRSADVNFVVTTVEDYPSAAKQYAATYHIGARLILYQSIAYVAGFWMIWIFPTVRQLRLLEDPGHIYWLICLQAIFEPLQGFFNFSVYRFSHFLRLKELHPQWPLRKLLRYTMRWTFLTKRSKVAKAKRESEPRISSGKSSAFIKSMRVNEAGELLSDVQSDSDNDESGFIEASPETSNEMPRERVVKRMSSLMGDLMTEFADYPDILNGEYKEVIGQDLFSYPTSAFPTVYAGQSFSGIPMNSDIPSFPIMSHFPVGQRSIYADEFSDNNWSVASLAGDDTQIPNPQTDPSTENSDKTEVDRSAKDDTAETMDDDNEVLHHEEDEGRISSEECRGEVKVKTLDLKERANLQKIDA